MNSTSKIAVVLDRSGSMSSIRDATIAGFNEFLKAQKAAAGEATILLAQFDHEYQVNYDQPVAEAPDLTAESYVPRGNTALLDAIGRTVNEVGAKLSAMPEADRPSKVIVVIITDGAENASHEFSRDRVRQMVEHQREVYKWDFMFLGANMDAFAEGPKLGVQAAASMTFSADPSHAGAMYRAASSAMLSARMGRFRSFSEDERKAAVAPDDQSAKPAGAAPV